MAVSEADLKRIDYHVWRVNWRLFPRYLEAWVLDDDQNPTLGSLPADTYVSRVHMHVTEAFDSDGADDISVGYAADPDAFCTDTDVSATGVKSPTMGALEGYNDTARTVTATYTNGGSEPSNGKALIVLEYHYVATEPA